jgi:fibronectin-binding autotransporter adhesin
MKNSYRMLWMTIVVLTALLLAAPAFGQSTVANSTWNGGTGPWIGAGGWVTNGVLSLTTPNNGDAGFFFNVTIGTGGTDIVDLDSVPITIDSLTLGASTGSAVLEIGSAVADTLTIGDPTAPNGGAAASLTVNSTGGLNVFAGSKLGLNIAAGSGTVTNNGTITQEGASGAGSSLLINDAGDAHQLTLTGSGTLTLQTGSVIQGVSGDETLINNSTIQGAGAISSVALTNNGTVTANAASALNITPNASGFTNTNTVSVDSGSALVLNTTAATNAGKSGLTNSGTIDVVDGGVLQFEDSSTSGNGVSLANNGDIELNALGAGGMIQLNGAKSIFGLTGTGRIFLSSDANNKITGVTGAENLVNQETIDGSGTISNLSLASTGTIIANAGAPLVIKPNVNSTAVAPLSAGSFGLGNTGTVQVDSGGDLVLNTTASQAASIAPVLNFGTITVSDGGVMEVIGTAGKTVSLANVMDFGGAGAINIGGTGVGGVLKLDGLKSTFDLNNGGFTFDGAPLPGTLTLSNNAGNLITGVTGTETLINGTSETISGAGTIKDLALVNKGTIMADGTNALNIMPNAGGFTNDGTLQVNSGGTLNLSGSTTSTNAATVTVNGTLNLTSGSTLAFNIAAGNGAVTNNGAINLNAVKLTVDDAGNAHQLTLGGTGTLTLQPGSAIQGVSGDEGLLNNSTIQGSGTISNLIVGNNGTIIAAPGGPLVIKPNVNSHGNEFVSDGAVRVNAGGDLVLDTTASPSAPFPVVNLGTIMVNDSGTMEVIGTAGKTVGFANVAATSRGGAINIGGRGAGGTLKLDGTKTSFDLTSSGGTGTLALSNNANNIITGVTGTETFINDIGETLSGAGTIKNLALVNKGTIIANGTRALDIAPNSGGFTNSGTVQVNAGSKLEVTNGGAYKQTAGTTDVNGTLISPSISITGGKLTDAGRLETGKLTNLASITASSTGFIGVGSGTFSATHGYQELANGTLDELISGKSAFGVIDLTGAAALNGTLDVTLEKGFVPTVGEQFTFMDFTKGDLTGTFSDFVGRTFDDGAEQWALSYNKTGGDLLLTAETPT